MAARQQPQASLTNSRQGQSPPLCQQNIMHTATESSACFQAMTLHCACKCFLLEHSGVPNMVTPMAPALRKAKSTPPRYLINTSVTDRCSPRVEETPKKHKRPPHSPTGDHVPWHFPHRPLVLLHGQENKICFLVCC